MNLGTCNNCSITNCIYTGVLAKSERPIYT